MADKPQKRNDMSDMVHRIKNTEAMNRRDYNADERRLIEQGREAEAKVAWHKRKER